MVSDGQTVHFWPHSVIHNRKAVHLTSLKLGWKVNFWPPLKRQNFRDAYGLNCYPHPISCLLSNSTIIKGQHLVKQTRIFSLTQLLQLLLLDVESVHPNSLFILFQDYLRFNLKNENEDNSRGEGGEIRSRRVKRIIYLPAMNRRRRRWMNPKKN